MMLDERAPTEQELMDAGDEPSSESKKLDRIFRRLRSEFRKDLEHWAPWYKKAKEWYGMYAGEQWLQEDIDALKSKKRPYVTFNRVMPTINVVSGHEISNRQEIIYYPRNMGTVKKSEYLSSAASWWRDIAECEDTESAGFRDTLICGMGWQHPRMDFDEKPEGKPACDRINPLEMVVDRFSEKANCSDAKRIYRVRTVPLQDARDMFPDAEDEDLHAAWADSEWKEGDPIRVNANDRYRQEQNSKAGKFDDNQTVTLVECHWSERVNVWVIVNPDTGKPQQVSDETYELLTTKIKQIGGDPKKLLQAHKAKKTVRHKTFLGAVVLEHGPTACPDHFGYQCITGLWDELTRTWFGLVAPMVDPQRWANKLLSQTIHIMNTTAKGGVLAEREAVDNQKQFKESWAQADEVTWVKSGSLSSSNGPRIQPKPVTPYPQGLDRLATIAFDAIRDSTGVNQEMLGLRDANQPGVLEYQRKQAGMTIIATFFDSLRRYRKIAGHMILYYIQNDIPDGTIIRVLGPEGKKLVTEMQMDPAMMANPEMAAQLAGVNPQEMGDEEPINLPLLRDKTVGEYDIIVDEAPTSPNVKDRTWSLLQPLFQQLPPQLQLVMIKYAPLPEAAIKELQTAGQQAMEQAESQPDPKVEAAKQIAEVNAQAKQAELAMKAQEHQQEMAHKERMANLEFQIKEREMQMKAAEQKMKFEAQQQQMAIENQNRYNELAMQRDFAQQTQTMKRDDMQHEHEFKRRAREEEGAASGKAAGGELSKVVQQPLADLAAQIQSMGEAMAALHKRVGAPRVAVRDPKTNRILRAEIAED